MCIRDRLYVSKLNLPLRGRWLPKADGRSPPQSASLTDCEVIYMINETYKSMLSGKSVIRELNAYAHDITRHPHLKPEDMFDYSLGNPSAVSYTHLRPHKGIKKNHPIRGDFQPGD